MRLAESTAKEPLGFSLISEDAKAEEELTDHPLSRIKDTKMLQVSIKDTRMLRVSIKFCSSKWNFKERQVSSCSLKKSVLGMSPLPSN